MIIVAGILGYLIVSYLASLVYCYRFGKLFDRPEYFDGEEILFVIVCSLGWPIYLSWIGISEVVKKILDQMEKSKLPNPWVAALDAGRGKR